MRWTAGFLLAAALVAGCSSESPAQPGLNGLDEFQESLTKESTPVSFPDACELVDEPGLRLLEGNALAMKDRSENDHSVSCEKWTEPEEGGVSSLTVRVSAIPPVKEGETAYEEILKRMEKKECERLPDIKDVACFQPAKVVDRLSVGRGVYQAEVIFRFTGANEKESRRFAEKTAAKVSQALAR
ncbi:hypothetical protein [Actinocorallia aurantiaca]|uniref:DUF3558 domain-containing protein n=1 Tax=Actinocorallia aurantiaca TaxID=46204 RepID=A0ABN3UUX7_9ACTN